MKRTFLYPHGVHTNANPTTLFRGEKEAEARSCPRSNARLLSQDLRHRGPSVTVGGVGETGGGGREGGEQR